MPKRFVGSSVDVLKRHEKKVKSVKMANGSESLDAIALQSNPFVIRVIIALALWFTTSHHSTVQAR